MKPLARNLVVFFFIISAAAESTLSTRSGQDVEDPSTAPSADPKTIRISLTLRIGYPVDQERAIEVDVPVNSTVLETLKMARDGDDDEKMEFLLGTFITSLWNVLQEMGSNMFWYNNLVPSSNVPSSADQFDGFLADLGIGPLIDLDDHFFFWSG